MRLIYTKDNGAHTMGLCAAGTEVKVGDRVQDSEGVPHTILEIERPHKPEASGRVYVRNELNGCHTRFYVSVLGMKWIEREDRVTEQVDAEDNPGWVW